MPPGHHALASLTRLATRLDDLGDAPLLGDGQDVVDRPVKHQTGGNQKNITPKMKGMAIITLAWMGSRAKSGLSLVCRNMVTTMTTGRMCRGSCEARSVIPQDPRARRAFRRRPGAPSRER